MELVSAQDAQELLVNAAAPRPWDSQPHTGDLWWSAYEITDDNGERLALVVANSKSLATSRLMAAAPQMAITIVRLQEELDVTWQALQMMINKLDRKTANKLIAAVDAVLRERRLNAEPK